MKQLGENIKLLRKANGLSQMELATKLDVSQTTIAHYEKGDRQPAIETLISLSQIFNISIDQLVDNKNYKLITTRETSKNVDINQLYHLLVDKKGQKFYEYFTTIAQFYDFKTIIDELIKVILYRVGDDWEKGTISEVDEHYITHLIRKTVNAYIENYPMTLKNKKAISLAVHGEQHTLGLELTSALLELNGVETLYLGGTILTRSLNRLIEDYQPDYIFMSITIREHTNSLLSLIENIDLKNLPVQIYIGGQGAIYIEEEIAQYTHVAILHDLDELMDIISK